MKKLQVDKLDRAFPKTPDIISAAIEEGFRRGETRMKFRHKLMSTLSVAACVLAIFAVSALALSRLGAPRENLQATSQPLAGGGKLVTGNTATPRIAHSPTPKPLPTPEVTQEPTPTPEVTQAPMPTPTPDVTQAPAEQISVTPSITAQPTEEAAPQPSATPKAVREYADEPPTVYTTDNGKYYHRLKDCQGMMNARALDEDAAKQLGKTACPDCAEVAVYIGRNSPYYHRTNCCIALKQLENEECIRELDAGGRGKSMCPYCKSDASISTNVYMTPGGKFIHTKKDCQGMQGAQVRPLYIACMKYPEKELCPACCGELLEWTQKDRMELIEFDAGEGFRSIRFSGASEQYDEVTAEVFDNNFK